MKKFTLLFYLIVLAFSTQIYAQCPFGGALYQGTAAPTISCTSVSATTCAFYNEYSQFTALAAGNSYKFTAAATSALAGPYTFGVYSSNVPGSPPVAFVTSATYPMTITYTPSVAGTYYVKCNYGGVACTDGASTCHTYTLECLSCPAPTAASTTTQPLTSAVPAGSLNAQVLRINLTGICGQTLTGLSLATTGSTAPATDIINAKVYYTTTTTFSTTTQFGSTVISPNGTFNVTGSLVPSNGLGYLWLVYDITCGAVATDLIDAEVLSMTLSSGVINPAPSNPVGTRTISAAATVSTNQPLTTAVTAGSINNSVLRVDVPANFCSGNVTQLNLTNLSTNVADVTNAKVYYTNTTTFSTAVLFGSTSNPAAAFTVSGSQAVSSTLINYFWVVFDVSCAATAGNTIDAGLTSVVTSGTGTLTPVTANPAGTRSIVAAGTNYSTVANGDWSNPATWACGIIPPTSTSVAVINNNVTVTSAVACGDLTVALGSTLTVSAGSLTVGSSSAGAAFGNSNRLMSVTGTLTITGGVVNMNGGLSITATGTFNMSGGTLNIDPNDGTATSYTANAAFLISTPNINATAGNINILDPSYSTVSGASQSSIRYSVATTNAIIGAGCTITLGGGDDTNPLNINGFYLESTSSTGTLTYENVILNGGDFASKRHASTYTSTAYVTSIKNLTINAGSEYQIPLAGAVLGISGNLVNNGVIINPNTANGTASTLAMVGGVAYSGGLVVIINTTGQTISGTGYFKKSNIELNPTAQSGNNMGNIMVFHSVTSPGLTLQMPLTITGGMRIIEGKVNTTAINFLALGHGTSIPNNPNALIAGVGSIYGQTFVFPATSQAYDGGWVNGTFKRWFAAVANTGETGILPVGFDTTNTAQVLFTTAPSTPGYVIASWVEGNNVATFAPALIEAAVTPSVIDHNTTGLWDINNDGAITGGAFTVSVTDSKNSKVTDFVNTTLIKRLTSVSPWALEGVHVASIGSNLSPTLSRTGIASYGQYTIGSGFGPLVACTSAPLSVTMSAISSSSATASWPAVSPAPGSGYDYFFSTVSTPPVFATVPSGNTASTSVILSLAPNTTYYFWVRSNCGGADKSAWTATTTFMTLPGTGCFSMISSNISPICVGNNIILSATGTWVSAQWFGPSGIIGGATTTSLSLPNIQTSANGTYSIQLVDATACTYTATFAVTANPLPVATAGATPNPICSGTTLNLSSSGGSTYAWSGPAGFTSNLQNPTRANVLVSHSGVYSVTVTSAAGCIATATVTVVVNAGPVAIASATPNPICVGANLSLSSSGGSTYSWSGPAGFTSSLQNPTRFNMQTTYAGLYTVSVTSGLGCSATASVNVVVNPLPSGVATATPSSGCVGSTVQLGAPAGSTYMWTGPQGYTSSLQNPIVNITSYLQAGTYKVKVTNAAGCSATFSVGFKVNYPPIATASYTIGSNCIGSNLALNGTGGGSFSWSGPAGFTSNLQNPVINNVSAANSGVYTLTVTSPNGCSAVSSVIVNILAAPVVTATADAYTVCEGSTAYLHATGGTNYEWTGPYGWVSNLQNPVINNIPSYLSGTYTVKVTNSGGCSTTASLVITVSGFINGSASALPNPAPTGSNVQLSATGASSYLWSGPNGFFSYEQNPVLYKVSSRNAGTYVVILTNDGKCQMTLFITLSIISARESGETIVAKETKVGELTTIYPNPAKNFIRLEYKGDKSIKYNIVNAQGVIITKDARSSSGSINIENLSSGTYAIIWSEDTENAQTNIGKFIKVD